MATAKHDPAPHGYEDDGITPKAPFGLNLDGTPRKSNRGARPGQRAGTTRVTAGKMKTNTGAGRKSDVERKKMLLQLSDMVLVMPLAGASMAPPVVARFGQKQADALAADAFLINEHAPAVVDGLIVMSQSRPGLLSWLDKMEENAPSLMLTLALINLGRAVVANHANPDMARAEAARAAVIGQAAQGERDAQLDEEAAEFERQAAAADATAGDFG
jgi:hypothetical protein